MKWKPEKIKLINQVLSWTDREETLTKNSSDLNYKMAKILNFKSFTNAFHNTGKLICYRKGTYRTQIISDIIIRNSVLLMYNLQKSNN